MRRTSAIPHSIVVEKVRDIVLGLRILWWERSLREQTRQLERLERWQEASDMLIAIRRLREEGMVPQEIGRLWLVRCGHEAERRVEG